MLRLVGSQVECLFDLGLPVEAWDVGGRLGPDVVDETTRLVVGREVTERRFVARAMRVDSTVVEADVRYPNDATLAADATRVLAREARKVAGLAGTGERGVRDRSLSAGRKLREISRTVARRTGQAKATVLRLTGEAGALVEQSVRETRRLAGRLRERARGARRAGQAGRRARPGRGRRPGREGRPADPSAAGG